MGSKPNLPRVTTEQRRARLLARHHLAAPAPSIEQVAGDLCGLHSSDPATVYLSARARRSADFTCAELEEALYERRTLARLLGMRRTMFVVPIELAGVVNAACTRALIDGERRRLVAMIERQGLAGDGAAWLAAVEAKTLAALAARGQAVARDLVADVPELGEKLSFGEGKTWGGTVGMSTRVLFLLATAAAIVRGRPRGGWTSSLYEWAPAKSWLAGALDDRDHEAAAAELVRRYLGTYGPATYLDVQWWAGWNKSQTRAALAAAGAREVALDGGEIGLVIGDLEAPAPPPAVALLPGLDPAIMGYKQRDWILASEHVAELFDRNGNAGPTVWVDGRVVGAWSQRRDTGEVVFELLEPASASARSQIEAQARALSEWLGDVRVIPRFPAPLDKRLRS